jgi:glyoxylase-like metal-dependent hydrolase (beta-lactamase superfamily II)
MQLLRWQVGNATIVRIGELDATPALDGLLPNLDPAALARADWLAPSFATADGRLRGSIQAFLVAIGDLWILVDPGVGNHKLRTAVAGWDDLHTDFLDRLQAALPDLGSIAYVVNTHLHFDHVGWLTRLVDGVWQPTFPGARHVMSAGEFGYWRSVPKKELADQNAAFADSVRPVYEAGLVDLVADDHVVIDGLKMVPSPGHTPHHVSLLIESAGQAALVTGDVVHHPCQITYPDWGAASDFDPARCRASRLELITRFAESGTLILGSHFAEPVAGHIRRVGDEFRFAPVAE